MIAAHQLYDVVDVGDRVRERRQGEPGNEGSEPESSKFVSAELRKGKPSEFDPACRGLR